jgi:hypothetical protein
MDYWHFQLLGNSYEIGQGRGSHLLHNLAVVDLERHFTASEFRRGLLVEQATSNQGQNFAFLRIQSVLFGKLRVRRTGANQTTARARSYRDVNGRPRACRLHPCKRLASPCWSSLRPDSLRRPT